MKEKIIAHKKQITLIALAVILLFCLWYTRPKSWIDLTRDYGDVREIVADVTIWEYDNTWEHMMSRSYDLEVDGSSDAAKELLALLENNSYRPMLRTILPLSSLEGGDYEGSEIWAAILTVNLVYEDTVLHLSFMGDRLSFSGLGTSGLRGYIIRDPSISDALSRLIMEHGVLDSENHM